MTGTFCAYLCSDVTCGIPSQASNYVGVHRDDVITHLVKTPDFQKGLSSLAPFALV
jgi:hypothetical protein